MADDTTQSLDAQIAALQAKRTALSRRDNALAHLGAGATEAEKDEAMLRIVGADMDRRLEECRAAGKSGWHTDDCSIDNLRERLAKNAEQGNFLDVAILAAMLHVRGVIAFKE